MGRISLLLIAVSFVCLQAQWNLPYLRPDKYDFSDLYGDDVNTYLVNNPSGFSNEMKKAWDWWKSHYIHSNGLVNHMRWDPSSAQTIGANEAVSEGQGYGLLLAVLMNDQATFDRIHQASTQYMWDNGRKSYFIWNWPSGEQGAATDADLDIGLAMVFADELQKKGLWTSNNAYGTRAMEIIVSIRQNMTSNDYLLPGDNWGGDALNNLNPSYFSVGALKVFDAYQNQVNFGPVIDKCYQVLQMMPHYDKGQTSNWITSSGGQGGRGGLDMGFDGIRTPYRIAMDAIWFNETRAVQYCKNTKKTLTQYNASSKTAILGQMGKYDASGNLVTESAGLFDNVAMWATAILGSKDTEYATTAISGRMIAQITGTAKDHFGQESLKDDKFYYNQSIAMLGFALLTGQFPNVYEDMQGDVQTGVALTEALASNISLVYFPGNVQITAKFESSVDWTVTFTGQSSGITKEYTGSGADVNLTWNGEGFTQKETVVASLDANGMAPVQDPSQLRINLVVQAPFVGINQVAANFENPFITVPNGFKYKASSSSKVLMPQIMNVLGAKYAWIGDVKYADGYWNFDLSQSHFPQGNYILSWVEENENGRQIKNYPIAIK